jgi:hypothetical protein
VTPATLSRIESFNGVHDGNIATTAAESQRTRAPADSRVSARQHSTMLSCRGRTACGIARRASRASR